MSDYTLFFDPQINRTPVATVDPTLANYAASILKQLRYNVLNYYSESIPLDATDTRNVGAVAITGTTWQVFILKVIGAARLEAICLDTDGVTSITGRLEAKGTDYYPGYIVWSTQNFQSAATLTGIDDSTVVESMILNCEED